MLKLFAASSAQPSVKRVLICQNVTCKRQNSDEVLAAFEKNIHNAASDDPTKSLEDSIEIVASGCLGHCGNGPMVLCLPGPVWYAGIQPAQVEDIVNQHLRQRKPITKWRYWPDGNKPNSLWPWLIGLVLFFLLCISVAVWAGLRTQHY